MAGRTPVGTVSVVELILSLEAYDGGTLSVVGEHVRTPLALPAGVAALPAADQLDAYAALIADAAGDQPVAAVVVAVPRGADPSLGTVTDPASPLNGWAVADSLSTLTGIPCAVLTRAAARAQGVWAGSREARILSVDVDTTLTTLTYLVDGRLGEPADDAVAGGTLAGTRELGDWFDDTRLSCLFSAVPALYADVTGRQIPWRALLRAARTSPGPARDAFAAAGASWAQSIAVLAARFAPTEIAFTGPGAAAFDVLFPSFEPSGEFVIRTYTDRRALHYGAAAWMRSRRGL